MKSSISIYNWIADVVVIVFPVGNITVKGDVVCTVAGNCAANLRLTNDRVAPMSSIAGTANPWVYTDRYKKPHCVCTLLSNGLSTFPACLMSAGCISFPAPSHCSCLYYWTSLYYYWALASNWVFFYYAGAFVLFPDSAWRYVPFFRNYSTSVLVVGSCFVHYSFVLVVEISRRAWMVVASEIRTVRFLPTSAQLSWLRLRMHQSSLTLVPLQIPSVVASGRIWRRVWRHRLLSQATLLQHCWIRWCTPVWFLIIAVLVICLGQRFYHLVVHISLWTSARNLGTLRALPLILPDDPSRVLRCLPSKQCYTDTLVQCCCPYMEYGQL